jgi:adenine phosphoribosyltransferase
MTTETIIDVKNKIRAVNDFPKPGIIFRDITTALKDANTLKVMIDYLCEQFKDVKIDYIAGIESRGFIFGMPMAYKLAAGSLLGFLIGTNPASNL